MEVHNYHIYVHGQGPSYADSLAVDSDSVSSYEPSAEIVEVVSPRLV